ncbi:hypothetical protein [Mesorhizobium caraganae]
MNTLALWAAAQSAAYPTAYGERIVRGRPF